MTRCVDIILDQWALSVVDKIVSTHVSDIYKVEQADGQLAVLKHLNAVGVEDESGGGALLRYYDGHGAVRLINAADDAHLLEFADGGELAEKVMVGGDDAATYIICDVVKQLHSPRRDIAPETLVDLREWFQDLFEAARNGGDGIVIHAAKIAHELFETTNNPIPLHGDLHHHNIINSSRGWLAIDPKGLMGDPCYDLANFYGNPVGAEHLWIDKARIECLTNIFVHELGYSRSRILKFAFVHNMISTVWNGGGGVNKDKRLEVARLVRDML